MTIWCSPAAAPSLRRIWTRSPSEARKAARVHGKQKPEPPAVPAAIPYTSVERLRFRDGKYLPIPDTDTTIPAH